MLFYCIGAVNNFFISWESMPCDIKHSMCIGNLVWNVAFIIWRKGLITMKKLTALLMSMLLVCGLAACGSRNGNDGTPSTQAAAKAETSAAVETPAAAETSAAASSEESETTQAPAPTPGKTLVVYYSASGNTERVANNIATATGGDLFKIEPADPYTDDDLNWRDENSRVVSEHDNPDERRVELVETTVSDWESYDTVFIGYPIWLAYHKLIQCTL